MDGETIFRKTHRGTEALARRDPALGPRERSALIMIDGRRPVRELAPIGNAAELAATLLAHGFIAPVDEQATVPAALQAVPASTPASAAALPLAKAQRLAVRRLVDLLGPGATDLCIRFEKVRSPQEFLAVLRHTEGTLRKAVGDQAAVRFSQELGNVQAA